MGAARITGVLAEDAERYWPDVQAWVERALKRDGFLDFEDVKQAVATRDMQLWLVMQPNLKAVCLTEISVYPKKRVLVATVVAGTRMPDWIDALHEHLTRFAAAHECDRFMAPIARRGWRPFARVRGWTERATFWRDLNVV